MGCEDTIEFHLAAAQRKKDHELVFNINWTRGMQRINAAPEEVL